MYYYVNLYIYRVYSVYDYLYNYYVFYSKTNCNVVIAVT